MRGMAGPDGVLPPRRAAVVEPHVMQRRGTVDVLEQRAGLEVVHASGSIATLFRWMRVQERSRWPHLLVVEMLPMRGEARSLEAVTALRDAGMRVMLLSGLAPRHEARRMATAGFDAIVAKTDEEETLLGGVAAAIRGDLLVTAVAEAALAGDLRVPRLSEQERKVLELYAVGRPIAEVADAIGVRQDTARKYLARIKQKYAALGRPAGSKLDLARLAWEDGMFDA